MKTLFRILTITMVVGLLTAGQAGAVSIDFIGNYDFSNNDNDAFQEVLTFDNIMSFPQSGLITEQDPDSDTLSQFIFVSELMLDQSSYISGDHYDFIDDSYIFEVYDTNNLLLFHGDLNVSAIELDKGAASINPSFAANLTNIQAGAGYIAGSSEIVDAIFSISKRRTCTIYLSTWFTCRCYSSNRKRGRRWC